MTAAKRSKLSSFHSFPSVIRVVVDLTLQSGLSSAISMTEFFPKDCYTAMSGSRSEQCFVTDEEKNFYDWREKCLGD